MNEPYVYIVCSGRYDRLGDIGQIYNSLSKRVTYVSGNYRRAMMFRHRILHHESRYRYLGDYVGNSDTVEDCQHCLDEHYKF